MYIGKLKDLLPIFLFNSSNSEMLSRGQMIGWRSKDQDLRTVMVKIGENAGRWRNILNQA